MHSEVFVLAYDIQNCTVKKNSEKSSEASNDKAVEENAKV